MSKTNIRSEQIKDDSIQIADLSDFAVIKRASGLTVDINAGTVRNDNVITTQSAQTVIVTNSTTNYVEIDSSGTVSSNAVGFSSTKIPLAVVVASGGNVTTVTDSRAWNDICQPLDATLTALAGLTITANSLIYGTGTDAFSVLAQNTTATRKFLRQVSSTAPTWDTLTSSDVGLGNVTNDAQIKSSDFPSTSVDSEIALFNGTSGKSIKRASASGIGLLTSGVLSTVTIPSDATKFLNGAATPAYAQVKDSDLSLTDITTNDVSTSKHGFAPKAPNDSSKFLDGTGAYSTPSATPDIIQTEVFL